MKKIPIGISNFRELRENEYAQYPIVPAARYVRYWTEIERKQKHQKEMIIEEVKNNPDQIGMGC